MSADFVKVAETKDIQPSNMKAFELAGEKVCIVNAGGKYYAIGNACTHLGDPLDEGTFEGYEVECPWHASKFDVRTGESTKPPAQQTVAIYEVMIEAKNILARKYYWI